MGFPKKDGNANGLSQKYGSVVPEDEQSNKNWQKGGDKVGIQKGRLTFSTSKVSDLNKGEWGSTTKTMKPGKAP